MKVRRASVFLALTILLAACGDKKISEVPEAPVTVELEPANVVLDAGQTQTVTAYVVQGGQRIIAKSPSYKVQWSVSDTSVVSLSSAGAFATVTGQTGGAVQLNAEVTTKEDRKIRRSIAVHSRPIITLLRLVNGNNQSGPVATELPIEISVQALNREGYGVGGALVKFAARLGNGSVGTQEVLTDANGYASTKWTLGPDAGRNTLEAWAENIPAVVFEAAGVATLAGLHVMQGNHQGGAPGQVLPAPLAVRVLDSTGRPLAAVPVTWTVLSGGGQVSAASSTTDNAGQAWTTWTLGTVGTQVVRASAGEHYIDFTAIASVPLPDQIIKVSGDGQAGQAGTALAEPFTVRVVDGHGNSKSGVSITWTILSGGGSVSPASGVTDASGLARTTWTVGSTAGTGSLRAASSAGIVSFSTTIQPSTSPPPTPAVSRLLITPQSVTLNALGAQTTLSAVAYDANNQPVSGQTINWTTSNAMIATIDNAGRVTARAVGTALLVATAVCCNEADTTTVTVSQQLASVAVSPHAVSVPVGATTQLNASGKDANGNPIPSTPITWSSSNTSVATVTSGLVRGVAAGTAVIRAISGTYRDSSIVSVTGGGSTTPLLTSITLTPTSTSLLVGATQPFTAVARDQNGNAMAGVAFSWTSSNTSVMTVSQGVVTALAVGAATLTVSSGSVSNSASVTVTAPAPPPPPPPSGSFSPPDIAFANMENGTTAPLTTASGATTGNNDITIMTDPTGAFGGKVARIRYARLSTGVSADVNRALRYSHATGIGLGQTVFMRGHVYIPTPITSMLGAQRKLFYVQRQQNDISFGFIKAEGTHLKIELTRNRVFNAGSIPFNKKFSLELQITTNSAVGRADGLVRIWVDGNLVLDQSGIEWLTSTAPFKVFLFGQQTQHIFNDLSVTFDEYRYWDNMALSTKRIGP